MKQVIILSIAVFLAACNGGGSSKIPAAPKNADDLKKIIAGKAWNLTDVGLEQMSMFKKEGEAPKLEISWLSETKDMDKNSKEALESHSGNKFVTNNDGTIQAFLTDNTMYGKQTYDIAAEEGAILFKVSVDSVKSKAFGMMQGAIFTYTVIGAEENKILLETGSSVNRNPVVYLMENKK